MLAPRFQIIDERSQLDAQDRPLVESALAEASRKTGVEFLVLVVEAVPGRAFRHHATEQRRLLSENAANSILLVLAVGDRHVEIATSPKHNALFTPSLTNQLLIKRAVPWLRQGRWADGIVAAVNAVASLLTGATKPASYGDTSQVKAKTVLSLVAAIGLVIAGVFGFQYHRNHTCRGCGAWGDYEALIVRSATSTSDGLEEHSFHCPRCQTNYTWMTSISYSSDDGSTSGSDIGGGGGGDGGGGADF